MKFIYLCNYYYTAPKKHLISKNFNNIFGYFGGGDETKNNISFAELVLVLEIIWFNSTIPSDFIHQFLKLQAKTFWIFCRRAPRKKILLPPKKSNKMGILAKKNLSLVIEEEEIHSCHWVFA